MEQKTPEIMALIYSQINKNNFVKELGFFPCGYFASCRNRSLISLDFKIIAYDHTQVF